MPKSGSVSGLGEKAVLLSTCSRVEVMFSRQNLIFKIDYTFRRGCPQMVPDWEVTAPQKEIETATKLARSIYSNVTASRSMEPCSKDFIDTTYPRPTNNREKLLADALRGDSASVRSLISSGVSPSVVDQDGNTSLHLALRHGCLETIRTLVGANSNLNARNANNETPLLVAANLRRTESVRLLIASGADVLARDKFGHNTAFQVFLGRNSDGLFPRSVPREDVYELLKILKNAGVDLNAHNDIFGDTLITIHSGSSDRTSQWADLIDLGVDVNGVNRRGESALIRVVSNGVPDESRLTNVKFLMANGADVHIRDVDGLTAVDYLWRDRVHRSHNPEWVRNIDETIKLINTPPNR
jgi:hypothetical protein